jgi:prefoldin subunit 5
MFENLRKHIESIRTLSSQFNALSDDINETIARIEHFLNVTCSLGLPAFVPVSATPDGPPGTYLEYRRVGNRFRIAVVYTDTNLTETVKPWADCTRDEKIESFKKLPDLLAKIVQELKSRIKDAQETVQAIKPILVGLQPEGYSASGNDSAPKDDIPF